MKLEVFNIQGGKTGSSVELPDDIFGIEPNEHAVWLAVKAHLANKRQGTHKSKERGEVAGSTKKIKKQKGTGTARAGDIKSPIFRGGGRIFGPRPRTYNQKLNKKVARLARKSAFSAKAAAGQIVVVEDFSFDAPKTKQLNDIINGMGIDTRKTLLVTPAYEKEVLLSGRNLAATTVAVASDLHTYQIMNGGTIILTAGSIDKIKETFAEKATA